MPPVVRPLSLSTPPPQEGAETKPERRAAGTIDDPVGGILLLLSALLIFSCSDATAKYLSAELPVVEIVWLRYIVFVLMLLPGCWRSGSAAFSTNRLSLQLLRGTGLLASGLLFVSSLPFLPLADATTIGFASPLFITALSIPMLGEEVGIRRWAAIMIGLIGVVIVMRPGIGAFQPAAILPVLSALAWAVAIILTRKMSATESTLTTLSYSAGSALILTSAMVPFLWVTPSLAQLGLALLYGLFATIGQWLVVLAYNRAGASVLAPLSYSQLVWAASLGFLVFGTEPDRWTLAGAAVIIASGLYTAHRERVRARERQASRTE
jgi:drug/metabolite transporter (DMT)-like permease